MNILFLFTDQQSNRALSCAGNPHVHTPHMDRLARSGARFEQAYCAAPVCGPSRACVATGRAPHEIALGWAERNLAGGTSGAARPPVRLASAGVALPRGWVPGRSSESRASRSSR